MEVSHDDIHEIAADEASKVQDYLEREIQLRIEDAVNAVREELEQEMHALEEYFERTLKDMHDRITKTGEYGEDY